MVSSTFGDLGSNGGILSYFVTLYTPPTFIKLRQLMALKVLQGCNSKIKVGVTSKVVLPWRHSLLGGFRRLHGADEYNHLIECRWQDVYEEF